VLKPAVQGRLAAAFAWLAARLQRLVGAPERLAGVFAQARRWIARIGHPSPLWL
jgi:hypothetical protein